MLVRDIKTCFLDATVNITGGRGGIKCYRVNQKMCIHIYFSFFWFIVFLLSCLNFDVFCEKLM